MILDYRAFRAPVRARVMGKKRGSADELILEPGLDLGVAPADVARVLEPLGLGKIATGDSVVDGGLLEPDHLFDLGAGEKWIDKTLSRIGPQVEVDRLLIEGKTIAGGISRASKDFDLVVLGAAHRKI